MLLKRSIICQSVAAITSASSGSTADALSVCVAPQNNQVYLKPSSSPYRKASFYIPRMREDTTHDGVISGEELGTAMPLFKIASSSCEYYAMRLPLLKAGFKRIAATDNSLMCNVIWGRSMPYREKTLMDPCSGVSTFWDFPTAVSPENEVYLQSLRLAYPMQQFNHFPRSHQLLGCKRGIGRSLRRVSQRMQRLALSHPSYHSKYHFMPTTWFYPDEKAEIIQALRNAAHDRYYIWKPARGSCGRGIFLTPGGTTHETSWQRVMQHIDELASNEASGRLFRSFVVQEYLEDPMLLNGRKMDLRLYVAVTSFDPLTVYLYDEGLVRLAAQPYETGSSSEPLNGAGRFRHLTNFSIGRKFQSSHTLSSESAHAQPCEGMEPGPAMPSISAPSLSHPPSSEVEGRIDLTPELKWPLKELWDYIDLHADEYKSSYEDLESKQRTTGQGKGRLLSDLVREQIALLIIRTLMAVKQPIATTICRLPAPGKFFEVYGFDVMMDSHLRAWLIEVNTLPSLESSSTFDYVTKSNMISDLLNLSMIEPFEREASLFEHVTSNAAITRPPAPHLQPMVHTLAELGGKSFSGLPARKLAHLTPQEQRTDLLLRMKDELQYARGFRRIFPPPLPVEGDAGRFPVTADSSIMQEDISMYAKLGYLSSLDEWALEG